MWIKKKKEKSISRFSFYDTIENTDMNKNPFRKYNHSNKGAFRLLVGSTFFLTFVNMYTITRTQRHNISPSQKIGSEITKLPKNI